MKKNYVKPEMGSEAFVANEYVAACWTVECKGYDPGRDPITLLHVKREYLHTHTGNSIVVTGLENKPQTETLRTYNNLDPETGLSIPRDVVQKYLNHWEVDVYDRATNLHPNASN